MSLGGIASRLPGGVSALNRALANSTVINLANVLHIDLADEERLEAALVRVIAPPGQSSSVSVEKKQPVSVNGESRVPFCSAGTMLGFGLVNARDYIKAVLDTYRDIGFM